MLKKIKKQLWSEVAARFDAFPGWKPTAETFLEGIWNMKMQSQSFTGVQLHHKKTTRACRRNSLALQLV